MSNSTDAAGRGTGQPAMTNQEAQIFAARSRKVDAIIPALKRYWITVPELEQLMDPAWQDQNDKWWSMVADVAGVRTPSMETRRMVIERFKQ